MTFIVDIDIPYMLTATELKQQLQEIYSDSTLVDVEYAIDNGYPYYIANGDDD